MKPLYREIALAMSAYRRCDEKYLSATDGTADEQHWHNMRRMHQDKIKALVKAHMPSGSGFDQGTRLDFDYSNECKLVFNTAFHHMDESGGYDGWTDHRVTVKPSLMSEFDLTISGPNRNDIKDMMHDTFYCALRTDLSEPVVQEIPRIIVDVDGGVIQNVRASHRVDLAIVDLDTEGGDEENIHVIADEECYLSKWDLEPLGKPDSILFDAEWAEIKAAKKE